MHVIWLYLISGKRKIDKFSYRITDSGVILRNYHMYLSIYGI